jgi:hypothetical protein
LKHENSISGVFGIENYKDILRGHFSFEWNMEYIFTKHDKSP